MSENGQEIKCLGSRNVKITDFCLHKFHEKKKL